MIPVNIKGFNERVRKVPGGCWLWTGADKVRWQGERWTPARVAWMLHGRDPLMPWERLRPTCGNAACVRPDHQGAATRAATGASVPLARLRSLCLVREEDEPLGCWAWKGERSAKGPLYQGRSARQLAYEAFHGVRLPKGSKVNAGCGGQRLCINPRHATLKSVMQMRREADEKIRAALQ